MFIVNPLLYHRIARPQLEEAWPIYNRRTGKYHLPYYHSQLNWYLILSPFVSTLYFPLLRTLYHPFMSPLVVMEDVMVNRRHPSPPPTYNVTFSLCYLFSTACITIPNHVYSLFVEYTWSRTILIRVQQSHSSPTRGMVFPATYYSYKKWNEEWIITPFT